MQDSIIYSNEKSELTQLRYKTDILWLPHHNPLAFWQDHYKLKFNLNAI